jgi:pyruvate kinase
MARRATKIVATLGPASSDPDLLEKMIRAGVNVVRLNFSHGKAQDHIDRARLVREAAQRGQGVKWPSWPTCRARRFGWASLPKAR